MATNRAIPHAITPLAKCKTSNTEATTSVYSLNTIRECDRATFALTYASQLAATLLASYTAITSEANNANATAALCISSTINIRHGRHIPPILETLNVGAHQTHFLKGKTEH